MTNHEDQLVQIEAIHNEYLAELAKLTTEKKTAVHDFLEHVRQKKILEITNSLKKSND